MGKAKRRKSGRPISVFDKGIPGQSNWVPIGPSVAKSAAGLAVSGRIARLAIAPGGSPMYVASALGGAWRSDDFGATWPVNQDSFNFNPVTFASTDLSCGAIAIDPAMPTRVYLGTGEGYPDVSYKPDSVSNNSYDFPGDLFLHRFYWGFMPAYRGVGPLVSDDGGVSWTREPVSTTSPSLDGGIFYELAIDPSDRENVVAATSSSCVPVTTNNNFLNAGLYRREPDGSGGYQWVAKMTATASNIVFTSVIATSAGGTTTFYAAQWGGLVYSSPDGDTWSPAATGFPTSVSRISLAVQPGDPGVLYALVLNNAHSDNPQQLGLFRLDTGATAWSPVTLASTSISTFRCAIAVDPNDENTIYIGGTASLYRASITASGAAYAATLTPIGGSSIPSGIHHVLHAPGDSNTLWVGTDGGAFVSTNPTDTINPVVFQARNTGLATMAMTHFSQHPTEPAVIFCGSQDNGTLRYIGEEAWENVNGGNGGYCVVNWNDPYQIVTFNNFSFWRSTDGGNTFPDNITANISPPGYPPAGSLVSYPVIASAPPSSTPSDADFLVLASGTGAFIVTPVYVSPDFGTTWTALPNPTIIKNLIYSLTVVSPTLIYVGTHRAEVYRYVFNSGAWQPPKLVHTPGHSLPFSDVTNPPIFPEVTSIAVDLADQTGNSIYATFAAVPPIPPNPTSQAPTGDYRHVWHYDGTDWTARSGSAPGASDALPDAGTSAIVVDPENPATLYVGTDLGVWTSIDSGTSWSPFSDGLPGAAVLDLQIHSASRLLRASLHGRGMFEIKLDPPASLDTEMYSRDTLLDVGRTATIDGLPNPIALGQQVVHWESPNIKVDVPTPAGWQTPTTSIDFYQFNEVVQDGSDGVATLDPTVGTVINRVYVEAHNRGIVAADVNVMLLLLDASPGLPNLPAGYTGLVQSGSAIGGGFSLVGVKTLQNLTVGIPQIAEFDLPSTLLPPPASLPGDSHYCLLALLNSPSDQFISTVTDVNALTTSDRKVAQKNLHIVAFTGTPPMMRRPHWSQFKLYGGPDRASTVDLVFDAAGYPGGIQLVLPANLSLQQPLGKSIKGFKIDRSPAAKETLAQWQESARENLKELISRGRYSFEKAREMLTSIEGVTGQPLLTLKSGGIGEILGLRLPARSVFTPFLSITAPQDVKAGYEFNFRLMQRKSKGNAIVGGSTYSVRVLSPRPPKRKKIS